MTPGKPTRPEALQHARAGACEGSASPSLAGRWQRFWFEPQSSRNLGICRLLFFAVMLFFFLPVSFSGWASLPESSAFWNPNWSFGLLRRLHWHMPSASTLATLSIVWKASLVLACIGLLTRLSTAVAFLLGFFLIGLQYNYGKIEHSANMLVFVLGILALSRSGDGVSIDALLRRWFGPSRASAGPEIQSGEYTWPIRAVWVLMSVVFFAAGMAKLRLSGMAWITSDRFSILMIQRHYDPDPPPLKLGLFIASHPWMARLSSAGSLCVECLFPLALFNRRLRAVFPTIAFFMQLGIGLIMNIWFWMYVPVYLFWVPWAKVIDRLFNRGRAASTKGIRETTVVDVRPG